MSELDALLAAPKKARIEIIPLIDVVFFLLATFVLFTLSLEKNRVLDVPMPMHGEPGDDLTVFIQASDSGAFYWKLGAKSSAEPITAAEIRPRLESYRQSVATPRVMVRSDGKAKLGAAVFLLDEVRRAGIKQVSIETFATKAGS
jgi:biopolymer transport protein ExbD